MLVFAGLYSAGVLIFDDLIVWKQPERLVKRDIDNIIFTI